MDGMTYPGNSKKMAEKAKEKPKVEKITTGEVKQRSKSVTEKFSDMFLGEDAKNVASYIMTDVAIPAAKNMISDMVSQGIERLLFGESRPRTRSGSQGRSFTSYSRMYNAPTTRDFSPRARAIHDFRDIVLTTREEAETVLDRLLDLISNYDIATVSDLYDLVGITAKFTDDKWGWLDLRGATVRRVRDGYLLNLPQPVPLD